MPFKYFSISKEIGHYDTCKTVSFNVHNLHDRYILMVYYTFSTVHREGFNLNTGYNRTREIAPGH